MADELVLLSSALSGTYAVERELGRGGMATVYLATDLKHDRQVAIKVLRAELAAAVGHDRFLREIKTTAQLSHPHIVPLLDSGAAGDQLFYVMPLVEGESLRDRLTRQQQLSLDDTLSIASDVASALHYAHGRGVIHRDIKPENIMLSGGEAMVADFGIARAITSAAGERITSTGLAVGTPAYMSPEQSTGNIDLDARSDIYSLGTVVFEMLAGEPPFTGPNPQSVIAKRLTDAVPHITTVRDVSPEVDGAVRKALSRTPADRWDTAADFAAALRGELVTAQRAAASPGGASARRPIAKWMGLAGVVAAVAITFTVLWPEPTAPPATTTVAPPRGMVLVPGGTYTLFGSAGADCPNCLPERSVRVDSFYIDSTEVTVGAYRAFAAAHPVPVPWTEPPAADLPVTRVMWGEADAFCRARDSLARLPTEEEWEAAARGHDRRSYAWGNTWEPGIANAGGVQAGVAPVRSYPRGVSPAGVADLIGNAWEWTATAERAGRDTALRYIIRGGAFDTPVANATAVFRPPPLPAAVAATQDAPGEPPPLPPPVATPR
jgi:formylglycine-generating enzyme required for sulfatase activity